MILQAMWTLERLWHLLGDGQWHDVKDIAESLEIPPELVILYMLFLGKHDLVEFNMTYESIKISDNIPIVRSVASK